MLHSILRNILCVFALASCAMPLLAQTANIKGKVIDEAAGTPVDYADVIVSDMNDKLLATGMVSQGTFTVSHIPVQDVMVTIRMMGYNTFISDKLSLRDGTTTDLGIIRMSQSAMGLEEVTVVADRNQIVYRLDRQAISGSASATAAGGTAVDVLATTPSVQIDINGDVTFRGSSNFLVYIDGKLSPLEGTAALQQIPAGTIEDIEIITTPSARYKTDGDVGIFNITTKRATHDGWSGLFNTSGSSLGTYSFDVVMNYRHGHHNFYLGGTRQDIQSKSDFLQDKTTDVDRIVTQSKSDGERFRSNMTTTAKGGWQWVPGKSHNLSVDFLVGRNSNWRGGDMTYTDSQSAADGHTPAHTDTFNSHDRYNLCKDLFQTSAEYVWTINDKNQLILQSRFRHDRYSIEYTESNMFDLQGERYEGTRGYEEEHHWDCDGSATYKLSYSSTGKIEAGYQYTTYSEHGDYKIKYWDRLAGQFEWQDQLATPFYYRRQTHSLYAMITDQIGQFSFDGGLRADRVLDFTDIGIEGTSRDIKRFDLFPSGHLSYTTPQVGTFTIGYSYRTNRPGIWNLEPYITYEDYYTKKIGNPDIRPEYIHSMELGWRKSFGEGGSLALTGYYRSRHDISDWVRRPYEPGVTLDSIVNAGDQVEKGFEASLVMKPAGWWNTTLNGSLFHYDFTASCPVCSDRDGWFYMINWINAAQVARQTKLQLDTHLVGPKILTQGREKAYAYADLAARQQFADGKLTLSVVVHDVFRSARYHNTRSTDGLLSTTWVRPKYPNILVSLSYNFNASTHKTTEEKSSLFEGKEF